MLHIQAPKAISMKISWKLKIVLISKQKKETGFSQRAFFSSQDVPQSVTKTFFLFNNWCFINVEIVSIFKYDTAYKLTKPCNRSCHLKEKKTLFFLFLCLKITRGTSLPPPYSFEEIKVTFFTSKPVPFG